MREKIITEIEPSPRYSLDDLYDQYSTYTKVESDIKKKKAVLKAQIEDYFKEDSKKDEFGNYWLNTNSGRFKKEIRKKLVLNETFADPILKRLQLYDKVVSFEPVYDLNMLKNYIADGTITEDEVEKMFKNEVSYAIKAEEKEAEEVPEES